MTRPLHLLGAILLSLLFSRLGLASGELHVDGRYAMGTLLEISLVKAGPEDAEAVFAEVERLEAKFSTHREQSELSLLNAAAGQAARPVSGEMSELLRAARELSAPTDGVYQPEYSYPGHRD